MNGYETDEMETISELLEGLEFDESDELGERVSTHLCQTICSPIIG